ncbi:MAG: DUF58 domain-containing protein [Planctomycetes bacterium]|nr:DUF58 domain-containing protein [Planctomycetota bacterium]
MAVSSVADVLKKVRRVAIVANRAVNDLFAGEYHSVFRGRGMEFDEVREYQPGDDIRSIDWNVTARAGAPFVKRYREERELTVLFLVDVSASGAFGSENQSKLDLIVEVAALLMFSALKNNDKVGLALFCDEVRHYFPPRKGKGNVLRLIRELIVAPPVAAETRIDRALEYVRRVQKRKAVVFLISDFIGPAYEHDLAIASKRHDVIAVTVGDPRERELPEVGFVRLVDAETGETLELDTGHPKVRELFQRQHDDRVRGRSKALRQRGVDELAIETSEPYTTRLHQFFGMRRKRFR